ncbi:MAG TPA: YajQ family cyclic di-GMP-binding protein [Polyangiaceae bacterium]|nr:YajQ family cyclic di-GMP-binding protein [Polyangiaceae bacterium]
MPSFDVVSEVPWAEVENALNQAQKELSQRFDFRGTDAAVERTPEGLLITATEEDRVKAALDVLQEKLVRRKVSLRYFDPQKPEKGPKGTSKMLVKVQEGIEKDKAKELVAFVKDTKVKVQAAIHEQSVRISGKKKDDLQTAIQELRRADLGIELQFKNFRD